ncbi:zinc-binding dehydrogenase [Kribbella sp. NPDC059898]|uniref:zinc-binding dehydrogenase n=1 Tax=Kribbella sp. NPDC059898 TaxID=3346995 RepID=UPI0036614FC9
MRAVQVRRFGGPEVLETVEVPEPTVGPGQVLIEVDAAEVLFLDTQLRAGWGREYFELELPFVPGAGVVGVVRSGTELAGRRVIAGTGGIGTYAGGGYAERAAVPEAEVFPIPDAMEPWLALTALHDGATALAQLERGKVAPGERVLVTAATGNLGNWLIPLLSASGATVVAAARGAVKLRRAEELGAREVADYSVPGWTGEVEPVDIVFDATGGAIGRAAYELTRPGGRFLAYGSASGDFTVPVEDRDDVTTAGIFQPGPGEWRELARRALGELAHGRLTPAIGQTFSLSEATQAHAAIEARRTLGKTLLVTGTSGGR